MIAVVTPHELCHILLVESNSQVAPRLKGRRYTGMSTSRGGNPGQHLESVCHSPPSASNDSHPSKMQVYLFSCHGFQEFIHYSTNSKTKALSSNLGLGVEEVSGCNLLSIAPGAEFLFFCECVKLKTIYLPTPPNIQWWHKPKTRALTTTDISSQKGKMESKRSHCCFAAVLKSSWANVESSLI